MNSTNPTSKKNEELHRDGEELACRYLEDRGIDIVERNWECKSGKADIIALEDDSLVFIEVKARAQGYSGLPESVVTAKKRTRYEQIAISYLTENQRPSGTVRFDAIAIQMTGEGQCLLRHHRDAFNEPDRYSPNREEAASKRSGKSRGQQNRPQDQKMSKTPKAKVRER
jgi:putative endonuclease